MRFSWCLYFNSGARGAAWVYRSGNLSIREILVVTSAYARPYRAVQGSPKATRRGWRMPSFLGGKSRGAFGQSVFFLAGNCMTIVAFEKEVSLKSLSLFSKEIVPQYWSFKLEKRHLISINGKKKFQRLNLSKAKSSSYESCPQRTSSLFHDGELVMFLNTTKWVKFLKSLRYMIMSITVKEITSWIGNLFYVIRNVSLTFYLSRRWLRKKHIRKRAEIWDSCSLEYFAITMQKV